MFAGRDYDPAVTVAEYFLPGGPGDACCQQKGQGRTTPHELLVTVWFDPSSAIDACVALVSNSPFPWPIRPLGSLSGCLRLHGPQGIERNAGLGRPLSARPRPRG